MTPFRFVVTALAVWRLSNMLVEEDGPGRIFRRLREASGIEYDDSGEILSHNDYTPLYCVYCTSVWVSIFSFFAPDWLLRLLAISGLAILFEVPESFLRAFQRERIEDG